MGMPEISPEDLNYVREMVRTRSAIVLEPEKAYLVQSRLEPVAKSEGVQTLAELVQKLRQVPFGPLHKKVVEAMTTNETSFFRDLSPFQALKETVLPDLLVRKALTKKLTIWCGASSSGQEPYSILFTILEEFPELKQWDIQFTATDISVEMLKRCQEGRYSQLEVNRGLPAPLLTKYFTKKGLAWQVQDDIRKMVSFREMNLAGTWLPFPKLDLVLIRNVMIYFDVPTKKQILKKARELMEPHAYLFLGGSETTMNLDDGFERVAVSG
ncbi:MAG: protein-glutamate O-methyltransferase CheR, partial [Nitrospira sp.]|nr:protein-glutamate O-methyltransferase CheR [Nitrospira sp.]